MRDSSKQWDTRWRSCVKSKAFQGAGTTSYRFMIFSFWCRSLSLLPVCTRKEIAMRLIDADALKVDFYDEYETEDEV